MSRGVKFAVDLVCWILRVFQLFDSRGEWALTFDALTTNLRGTVASAGFTASSRLGEESTKVGGDTVGGNMPRSVHVLVVIAAVREM